MNVVDRAKNIILSPKSEWEVIKTESISVADMFKTYAAYLALIGPIASFIGFSVIGLTILGIHSRVPVGSGILRAIIAYIFTLIGALILGYVIDALAPNFGSPKDINASMKVSVFSMTAAWIAGVFAIIPALSPLSIVGLYSFYLLYLGLKSLKEVPPEKTAGYFLLVIIIGLVIYFIVGLAASALTVGTGYPG